ncbi:MAG: threonylcarbamoyl-AMP synthase [Muribaculaceae bacterium]|nr:threonylcarbamoyl-AMP synthase [Muribaculaceae bacterium]
MKEGGIILYPTDTVWGIGCDARNEEAIRKIYRLKQREDSKSMLVLVGSEGMLQRTVKDVPEIAWQLIDVAVNPMTIIYDNPVGVADILKAEDGSLGIRISSERFSRALCERMRGPIVSTSANISGKPTPQTFAEISSAIKEGVDYVCNFRQKEKATAKPSNIIKITRGNIVKVIR